MENELLSEVKKNPCIVSIFMKNIDTNMVSLQKKVVEKYNKSNIPFLQVLTDGSHAQTMRKIVELLEQNKYDAVLFLDIDAVPVSEDAIDYFLEQAYNGKLIGNAQRSNHIDNNQHIFAAPNALAFTLETYHKIGQPSFEPNHRGDVAEELTFKAEESKIPVEVLMPTRYDAAPVKFHWELDQRPYWALAEGMPVYGIGTTFGVDGKEMFWHMYQSFHLGQKERFEKKCKELLDA